MQEEKRREKSNKVKNNKLTAEGRNHEEIINVCGRGEETIGDFLECTQRGGCVETTRFAEVFLHLSYQTFTQN